MDWILGIFCFLLLLLAAWFAFQYFSLRRRLKTYAETLRRLEMTGTHPIPLAADQPGLEDLSNAVKALVEAQQSRIDEVETEHKKLAAVLEQMTDGVLIADASGRLSFANPAAERYFATPNAIGRSVAEVVRQHQLVEAWRRCQESREEQSEAVEIPALRQFLQLYVLPDRQTGGCLLLVQDLTRVRRLETVRRDFISNVSHELRTPLASLKALTETLNDGALEDPPAARRFLGRIETEVDALTQMAQELLELARIESGQLPLEFQDTDPLELLVSSAERMRAQAERSGLSLRVEPGDSLPKAHIDLHRMQQVLVNLVHNAIKFTTPGGEVVLKAVMEDAFIHFSVSDTGAGIPEDDLKRIFERFYKADRARSGGGTGLGLSISRHIVEAHGGSIWAESVEGRGSTFHFTVPIQAT